MHHHALAGGIIIPTMHVYTNDSRCIPHRRHARKTHHDHHCTTNQQQLASDIAHAHNYICMQRRSGSPGYAQATTPAVLMVIAVASRSRNVGSNVERLRREPPTRHDKSRSTESPGIVSRAAADESGVHPPQLRDTHPPGARL